MDTIQNRDTELGIFSSRRELSFFLVVVRVAPPSLFGEIVEIHGTWHSLPRLA